MGAYLSKPVTEKHSSDESSAELSYGASSMQGWRVSQEDAHNAILEFDKDTHLFAVYDGHGGHEVSAYTATELPQVIKKTKAYTDGNISEALTDSFMEFDASLVQPEVVAELTRIATSRETGEESDDSEEDVDDLYREATMPLAEVIAKYADTPGKDKVASPFLKAKKSREEEEGAGSSSSSSSSIPISLNGAKEEEEEEEEAEEKVINGEKHMVNGGKEEKINGEKEINGGEEEEDEKQTEEKKVKKAEKDEGMETEEDEGQTETEKDDATKKDDTEGDVTDTGKAEKTSDKEQNDTVNKSEKEEKGEKQHDAIMNGETKELRKGKGKGGGGGKGKALLKREEVHAMMQRRAKERKREAAIKAAEIYRRIQKGKEEEEEEDDDDDDEEDESFDDGGDEVEEDVEGESDEEEEEEEEEEEDEDEEGAEEEDDPYTQFALNMKEEPGFDSGCTACVALLRGNELFVANVGDSRCVVCRAGSALDMSVDHKPEDDPEATRIRNAGGRVTADGRVNGGLNLSRAIGDHGYKQNKSLPAEDQMISPMPDVRSLTLTPEDQFIIVACDGIWNSLSSQEACDFVSERLGDMSDDDEKLSAICEELFDHCLAPDTHGDGTGCDNMTCIIIRLKDCPAPTSSSSSSTCKRPLGEDKEGSPSPLQPEEKKSRTGD